MMEKREGETPLQALERFRLEARIGSDVPMTYAGRLDPMASGVLLILVGDECKRKEKYLGFDKEYECGVLFGIESDTGDILGLPQKTEALALSEAEVQRSIEALVGTHELPYPAFSSKKVEGKHLFEHALQDTLESIEIPTRSMEVRHIEYLSMRHISSAQLFQDISTRINAFSPPVTEYAGHDFRKKDIEEAWRQLLSEKETYSIARFRAHVSAGTYIRALAPLIGRMCRTGALALSIHRTRIGNLA